MTTTASGLSLLEDINNVPEGIKLVDNFDIKKINIAKVITGDKTSYVQLADTKDTTINTKNRRETLIEPIIPYKGVERGVYYITGRSGCGKSLIALRLIATQYHKLYPENKVFYCCSTDLKDDVHFQEVPFIKQLDPLKIYSLNMEADDEKQMIKELLSNSLVIFDDLDMARPDHKKIYTRLEFKILEVGRKFSTSLCIISHLITGGHQTTMLLREIDLYFTFKDSLLSNRLLLHYKQYKPEYLEELKSKVSSWICFNWRLNCIITPWFLKLEN